MRGFGGERKEQKILYIMRMKPIEHISVGTIIQMVKTGKEFIVDSISPRSIVLKECTRFVSFSKSALNERLKNKSAVVLQY